MEKGRKEEERVSGPEEGSSVRLDYLPAIPAGIQ